MTVRLAQLLVSALFVLTGVNVSHAEELAPPSLTEQDVVGLFNQLSAFSAVIAAPLRK